MALNKVREDGEALGGPEVAEQMRNDIDVVLAAANADVDALEYASAELRGNPEVIIAAVRKSGDALYYASDELKADRQFILDCVALAPGALEYAAESLRLDKGFLLAARNSSASFRERASNKGVRTDSFKARQKKKLAAIASFSSSMASTSGTIGSSSTISNSSLSE